MSLKLAAYNRVMNEQGYQGYDPYQDPNFMKDLKVGDVMRTLGRTAQIGAALGGVGKTLHNLKTKGRFGLAAPIIGGLGLTSLALDDYVQKPQY